MQECDDRAGRLVNDLFDQFERVLREPRAEANEGNVRLFARGHRSNFADLDLGSDHLVPKAGNKGRDIGQPIMALVSHEHPETGHIFAVSRRRHCGANNKTIEQLGDAGLRHKANPSPPGALRSWQGSAVMHPPLGDRALERGVG